MAPYIVVYLLAINGFAFILSAVDKRRAIQHKRRIRERTLLWTGALGGSIGLYTSMLIFRHKTRHKRFMIGVPAIIALQIVFGLWITLK